MSAGRNAKRHPGKLPRQLLAQRLDIFGGRPVSFLQLDLDVAVLGTDHAGVVVGHVDAGDRHADVVGQCFDLAGRNDLADRLLHFGKLVGRLFDTGADLGPHVHQDVPGIDRGEEVAPEKGHQQKRDRDEAQKARDEHRAAPQSHGQDIAIVAAYALEAGLKGALKANQRIARRRWLAVMMHMRLQQIVGHGRHQRARQDERPYHREHHRFSHRHEQEARDPGQEEHRHEHDADAKQRDEGRRHDLVGAVQNRLLDRPCHAPDGS